MTMAEANPHDYQAIKNTIARYCVALDTKDWPLLQQVFIEDVEADYPFNRSLKGWKMVADGIHGRLQHITSQHALTTQIIEIAADGNTAIATTYFTGIHFGQGRWKGKEVSAWGKYDDTLIKVDSSTPEISGASGAWRISKRVVTFMGRLGEEGVLKGENS